MRSRWWSQNEGLAIALTLDRLGPAHWHEVAFGASGQTALLDMLDATLAQELIHPGRHLDVIWKSNC